MATMTVMTFPTYRRFLSPLQQMTFENIVAKEEIDYNATMFSKNCLLQMS